MHVNVCLMFIVGDEPSYLVKYVKRELLVREYLSGNYNLIYDILLDHEQIMTSAPRRRYSTQLLLAVGDVLTARQMKILVL